MVRGMLYVVCVVIFGGAISINGAVRRVVELAVTSGAELPMTMFVAVSDSTEFCRYVAEK